MKSSTIKKSSATKVRPSKRSPASATSPGNGDLLEASPKRSGLSARKSGAGETKKGISRIVAHADIGFGNTLFIRGEGGALSWDHGIALENRGADQWTCELSNLKVPAEFKLLINDQIWSQHENFILTPGEELVCEPIF